LEQFKVWEHARYLHKNDKRKREKELCHLAAVELVRFARNVYEYYRDKTFGTPVLIEEMLFNVVIEVYKAITTHGWDKTRDDVKFVMSKKW
jgi:hypothetical protein